ncbi:MAG: hypothetical protein KME02_13425 [Aphanothece saxicola GSE-SYN-MK-01-06B]|jgi:hypothetical protein|nr:hypothetical protein [Aphanothece saxicola GSE-SYN-MK-01-06B]
MTSSKEFKEFDSAILADRLAFMAIALFVVYLITLLASILPVRLLDTAWQLRFISASLDSATVPLVALGLLHLAAYLDPDNPTLQRRRSGLARLAIVAVIGFLLIVPLQAYAGWQSVATARANVARQLSAATGTFDLLQDTITTASSLDNLQARLQAMQTPSLGIRFDNLGLPLPETKRTMLVRLKEVRQQVEARIQAPTPKAIEAAIRDSLRVMLSSFALAIAFAMGAQRKGSDVPLLVEWHTKFSVQSPRSASPAPSEEDYFSRLVPEEDETSETGVPPPP